jgi:signal transduction histidine kinase
LHDRPLAEAAETGVGAGAARAAMFGAMLRASLGEERALRVHPGDPSVQFNRPMAGSGFGRGPGAGAGPGPWPGAGPAPGMMMGGGPDGHRMPLAMGAALRTEVQLRDGTWARFDTVLPPASDGVPWRLLLALGVLLAAVLLLSFFAVRWVTRPLHVLATAAEALGRDIHSPKLPEDGPLEIRQAAHAFNTMQDRLTRFIEDRTRMLAAMSHDLKTPITRMRLRAELMDDEDMRRHFEGDLKEMEEMVKYTLEFMRGLGGGEVRQPVNVMALLESLQSDNEAMGRWVRIEGQADAPYIGVVSLLKRCLANLVDNAVVYGGRATVTVEDSVSTLTIRVRDEGPGIPEEELEKVFEPFYRLEGSRSRATGGTGLGLAIARNIARGHGGDIALRNLPEGGLEAVLSLPR